jgi:hypothetical protein
MSHRVCVKEIIQEDESMKTKIIYREPLGNPERQYRQDRFVISSCMSLATDFEEDKSDIRECIRNIKEVGCNLTEYI